MNPLLHPFNTPHETFPFPSISPDDIREAIAEGIRLEDEEIQQIIENPEPPTFENVILPFSRSGSLLEKAETVMYNLLSAESTDELQQVAEEMAPVLSEHSNNILLNEELFAKIKSVNEQAGSLSSAEDHMLLDRIFENFERGGANLGDDDKAKFRKITSRLSELTLRFSQNVLKQTAAYTLNITDESDLAGLPETNRRAARLEAESRGEEGWTFTLQAPSYVPFVTYADNRELRRQMYMAQNTLCATEGERCNFEVVREIVDLRRELASLLGCNTFAEYSLRRRMAQTTEAVEGLLNELIEHYLPAAQSEVQQVADKARSIEGSDFELMPWDFAYYAQKLKKERYDYDPELLRPYFPLSQVKEGVLGLATKLYGITFSENKDIPVYHPDVQALEVYDKDGSFLAVLYLDFFPRETKQGGAWMTNYRDEECLLPTSEPVTAQNSQRPHVSVTTNFTKPAADTPSLLTLGEVQTFLHEFGHALHGIFAMTHHAALSGTSVFWDFVELPSQIMENFAVEPEFLLTFAKHYQTGEPLPQEHIDRILAARNFNAAYQCIRQVSFGLLDMAYYTLTAPLTASIPEFEQRAWSRVQLLPAIPETCMSTHFGHIMSGGYAAGYYSYKWAELLDADAFERFKEEGIFSTEVAQSFRTNILSKGGTEHPMDLYVRFRGRRPSIDALLHRDGIEK